MYKICDHAWNVGPILIWNDGGGRRESGAEEGDSKVTLSQGKFNVKGAKEKGVRRRREAAGKLHPFRDCPTLSILGERTRAGPN